MRLPGGALKPAMYATTGLRHVLAHERRGALLVVAADLADEHDGLGLVVGLEALEALEEAEAVERVAAHADARSTGRCRPSDSSFTTS